MFACLVTDKFGLFTEIVVCTFLRGWWLYGLKPFFFILSIVCVYAFFCSFLYGALCPRSCSGSCDMEMSISIITFGGDDNYLHSLEL